MQQPKVQIQHVICIAALLAVCLAFPRAYGQEATTTSNTQPENSSSPGKAAPLPQITVTANVLKQRIDTYISKISGGYVRSDDHPLARWRIPICPLVAGLPHNDGQFVFDRFSDDLSSTYIPLGETGCRPNFFIVATMDPEATLKAWWHHDFDLNDGQVGFDHFIGTPRPIRIWYNAKLISGNGTPTNRFGVGPSNVFQGIESFTISDIPHQEFGSIPDLKSVIVVIDLTRVVGLDWHQVTDYIAMAGITEVNLNAHVDGAPTIMSLFSTSGDARPQSLSDWDRSFIRELYLTDPAYRHQRVLIAKGMFNDVGPYSVERK
jgi:hypothetical protein